MIKGFFKILLVISFAITFYACKEIPQREETNKYSIGLGEFKTFEEAEIFKSKLDFQLWRDIKIIHSERDRFILAFGKFNSSFDAGKKAFEYYNNSLLNYYKVVKDNDYVVDVFSNVLFIAKYQGRPSVYNYNLLTRKSKLLWSRWGRKVISLNHSNDRNIVFFTTALGYGKQGKFPYVRDARLYKFSPSNELVDEIAELNFGLQLYTYWENKDSFKINFTQTDSINSEVLIQKIYSIDKSGKINDVKKRSFTLTKDGFPGPPAIRPEFYSSKGTNQIRLVNDGSLSYLYLRDLKNNSEIMLTEFKGELKNVKWTDDEEYLFLILKLKDQGMPNLKDKLLVINTGEKKIIRNFIGPEYKNLLVQGNLLFFDQQYQGVSQITIFNFTDGKVFDEIRIPGGCGINNLFPNP